MVITTAQLHSTKPELRLCAGSNPACGVLEIRNGENLWQWPWLEIKINAFKNNSSPWNRVFCLCNNSSDNHYLQRLFWDIFFCLFGILSWIIPMLYLHLNHLVLPWGSSNQLEVKAGYRIRILNQPALKFLNLPYLRYQLWILFQTANYITVHTS